MASCHRLVIRNTFLEVVPDLGGDASGRVSRSAGPWTKANHPPTILGESLAVDEPVPCACATPWSSVCGDWGYQIAVMSELAADMLLEAVPAEEPLGSWACQGFALEELWLDDRQDVWNAATAFEHSPDMEALENIVQNKGRPIGRSRSPKAGSYLAALMKRVDASCLPGGKNAVLQPAAAVCRLPGLRAAVDKRSPVLEAKPVRETITAEKLTELATPVNGNTKSRRGKRGGRKQRVPAAFPVDRFDARAPRVNLLA